MNAPFQVAQLTTGQSTAAQPKIISLTKPAEGQSVTVKIEGPVKLDFTAISSEKITLVHGVAPVAERLTILFDNKSIIVVDPFWDSSGKPLHLVSGIELEPGRVVSAEEFATLFPMTDNQDVLAGAGTGGAPVKSSGGEFEGPHVDGLPDFVRLPLLGPEELGNWKSDIPTNLVENNPANAPDLIPTFGTPVTGIVEEEHNLRGETQGNEDTEDASGNDTDTAIQLDNVTHVVNGDLAGLVVGGNLPITFTLNDPGNGAVSDKNGILFSQGGEVHWIGFDTSVPGEITVTAGVPGDGPQGSDRVVFTLTVHADGTYTFELVDQIDQSTIAGGDTHEETTFFDFSSLLHIVDNDGDVLTLPADAFTVGVIDDTPIANQSEPINLGTVQEDDLNNFDPGDTSPADNIEGSQGNNQDSSNATTINYDLDNLIANGTVKIGFDEFKDTDNDEINGHAVFQFVSDSSALSAALDALNASIQDSDPNTDIARILSSKGDAINGISFSEDTLNHTQTLTFTADDRIVFTLTINQTTSELTYTQVDQIDHPYNVDPNAPPPEVPDDCPAFEDQLTFDLSAFIQVTDFDKDPATLVGGTVSLTVKDDIPVFDAPVTDSTMENGVASGTFDVSIGTDEPAHYDIIPLNLDSMPDGFDFDVTQNPDGTLTLVATVNGDPFYTMEIDPAAGTYEVTLQGDIPGTTESNVLSDVITIPAGGPQNTIGPFVINASGDPSGTTVSFDGVVFDASDVMSNPNDGSDSLNPNNNGFGIGNSSVGEDEGFIANFSKDVHSITFDVNFTGNGVPSTDITYQLFNNGVAVGSGTFNVPNPAGPDQIADNVIIDGGVLFDQIIVQFEMPGGGTLVVQNFQSNVDTVVSPTSLTLDFELKATDFDGDAVCDQFQVTLTDEKPTQNTATTTGIVEEEHLVANDGTPPILSTGNEDELASPDLDNDTVGDHNITTNEFGPTSPGYASLSTLVTGGNTPLTFTIESSMAGTQVLDSAGVNMTSKGVQIEYANFVDSVSGETSIQGVAGDRVIFSLTVDSDGDYHFTLFDQIDHHDVAAADDVEGIRSFNFTDLITATDVDGDSVQLQGSAFTVQVIDDIPIAEDVTDAASVTEGDGAQDLGLATSVLKYSVGADEPASITFGTGDQGGTLAIDQNGHLIYTPPSQVDNTSGDPVTETFTYTVTDADGDAVTKDITFQIDDTGVANVQASNLLADEDDISGANGNANGPGDDGPQVLQGDITFDIGSDTPATIALSVVNTNLTKLDGTPVNTVWNAGTKTLTGYGTDATTDKVFTIVLSGTGDKHYTFTLLQPVDHPLQDDSAALPDKTSFEDNLSFTVDVTVTDSDGSSNTGSFTVDIDDDSPVAQDYEGSSFAENSGAQTIGDAVTVLGISAGADGLQGTLQGIVFDNQGTTGGTLSINLAGELIYTPPSQVNNSGGDPVTETFEYTVTDKDGDAVTHTVTFDVTDTGVSNVQASNLLADEDNIATVTGNAGGPGDDGPQVLEGDITFDIGSDTPATIALSVVNTNLTKLDGTPVNTVWNAGTKTLTGYGTDATTDKVFTIVLSGTGDKHYTFTLLQPVDHPLQDDSAALPDKTSFEDNLSFTVDVTVTDSDGSSNTGSFTVDIDDDSPVAQDYEGSSFAENSGAHTIGDAVTVLGISAGADGLQGTLQGIVFDNQGTTGGTLSINLAGELIYTPPSQVDNTSGDPVTETFKYTVTDKDGDAVTHTVTFDVTDTGVSNVQAGNLLADEDNIASLAGNPGGPGDDGPQVLEGDITFDIGSDTPATIALSVVNTNLTKLDGTPVNTVWNAGTKTLTGYGTDATTDKVFTIVLSGTGDKHYTFTLLQPVDHPLQDDSAALPDKISFEDNLSFTVDVTVTDSDGSSNTGSFTVDIDDDSPTANNDDAKSVSETAVGTIGGNVITAAGDPDLSGKDALGADGGSMTHVKLPGASDFVDITTGNAEGGGVFSFVVTGVGTYTFKADGTWTLDPSFNASTSDQSGTFQYRITDGDGDASEATQPITVLNSNFPLAQTGSVTGKVEEEHLNSAQAVGNEDTTSTPDEDDDTNANFNLTTNITTGNLSALISGGLDGTATYGFQAGLDGTNVTFVGGGNVQSQGANVIYDQQGTTLWGFVDGGGSATAYEAGTDRAVFRIDLNTTTGLFTFTLLDNIDHHLPASADNVEGIKSIDLSGKMTVTDSAEPETMAFNNVSVKVIDDIPTVIVPDHAVVANGNSDPLTLDLDLDDLIGNNYGADGAGTVRFPDSLNSTPSGLTSSGVPITYAVSGGGLILTAMAGASLIFTVTLDPNTGGHYTIDMQGTVDSTSQVDFFGTDYAFSGGNTGWVGLLQMSGNQDVLLTPFGSGGDTINGSSVAVGVGGGNKMSAGEGMRLDFVTNLSGDPGPSSKDYHLNPPTYQDHVFDDHYLTNGASLTFGAGHNNSTVQIAARDDADGNDAIGDGAYDSVSSITIKYGALTQVVNFGGPGGIGTTATDFVIGDRTYNVHFVDVDPTAAVHYGVEVIGILDQLLSIATFTTTSYNSLDVLNLAGDEFNITGFGGAVPTTNPSNFTLPIQLVDGDGDAVNSAIAVTVVTAGAGVQDHSNDLVGDPHTYTATALNQHIIGSDFNDTLNGDAGNLSNVLSGGAGDDTINGLGGNDFLFGGAGNDTLEGGAGNDRIDGESGNDTATYANAGAAVTVDLSLTTAQNTGGAGTDTLVGIENLTGSAFNDTLTGDANDNVLAGGAGNDTLNGGLGNDTASYAASVVNVNVSLLIATAQATGAGNDTLVSIENLIGGSGNDGLIGDNNANILSGGSGNDVLTGNGGDDTLIGGAGNDQLLGGAGNDILDGGDGNDTFDGGLNVDTITYANAGGSITFSLAVVGPQATGGAGTDTVVANTVENLTGSNFADTLTGDGNANVIQGLGGNDVINGGAGADILIGGDGNDTMDLGADAVQDIVRYNNASEFGDGTITNFHSLDVSLANNDRIEFGGALNAEFDDIVDDDDFAWATGNGVNGGGTAVNLDTTSEAIFLAGTNGEGLANADLKNATLLAAELNSEFTISASVGQDALVVVNATDANAFSVWRYVEAGTAGVQAGELTMIGSFTSDAHVKTGNLDLTT